MDFENNSGMRNDERVKKILLWRESLTLIPDERFFEIMHTYLGAIQTPFNKPNLIERLSAVFRKEQTQRRIISFFTEFDLKVLSLISLIKNADQSKIISFFRHDYRLSAIYAELLSLSDRLLIFSYTSQETNLKVIALNPLLEKAIMPYLGLNCLIPPNMPAERSFETEQLLSPLFLSAFISYINSNPEMIKGGMNLKKKDTDRLEAIFSEKKEIFDILLNAFVNLGLARIKEKSVNLDFPHLEKFVQLPECWQYAYLATAGALHLGRTGMRFHAQLLLDLIASVPQEGFTKHSLCLAAFVLENSSRYNGNLNPSPLGKSFRERKLSLLGKSADLSENTRSALGEKSQEGENALSAENSSGRASSQELPLVNRAGDGSSLQISEKYEGGRLFDMIVETAIKLKLFVVSGKTEKGEEVYVPSPVFAERLSSSSFAAGNDSASAAATAAFSAESSIMSSSSEVSFNKKGLININAGTIITVMPGFSLRELLPLSVFMEASKCSTVTEFDLTRKSASRSFDLNYTPEKIFELLETYTAYEIPQNLKMNVEEWYKTYSSATLYKGYVLKVEEKTARVLEKNPNISKYIQVKLAEGIYLLNLPLENDISEFIESSNLEFMGNIREAERKADVPAYPQLADVEGMSFVEKAESLEELSKEGQAEKKRMLEILEGKGFSKQVTEMLRVRIERGIILSEEQISSDSVKIEILEADGMNYAGKVRLLENAISQGDSVEISMPDEKNPAQINILLGKPVNLIKQETDSIVKLAIETEEELPDVKLLSVSRAHKIRLIKTSLFS